MATSTFPLLDIICDERDGKRRVMVRTKVRKKHNNNYHLAISQTTRIIPNHFSQEQYEQLKTQTINECNLAAYSFLLLGEIPNEDKMLHPFDESLFPVDPNTESEEERIKKLLKIIK